MNTITTSARQYIIRSGLDRRSDTKAPALILLRLPDVMALCGLSRSSIYQAIQRDAFPRPCPATIRNAGDDN
jgi:prophage regulatory protein